MAPVTGYVEAFRRQAFGLLQDPRSPVIGRLAGALESFQTSVLECFAPLYRMPFVRGVQIEVPALAASGEFLVIHKLQRKPRGFLVLDALRPTGSVASIAIYRRASAPPTESTLTLWSSGSFDSLTLWVW